MAKILIVDDEIGICEEFKNVLEEDNHQVDIALNGQQALRQVEENSYNIVFLDILMPKMEGREVFQEIKAIRPSLPVVVMSGYLPANKEQDLLTRGALACLKKPLDLEHIQNLIRSVTSRS